MSIVQYGRVVKIQKTVILKKLLKGIERRWNIVYNILDRVQSVYMGLT